MNTIGEIPDELVRAGSELRVALGRVVRRLRQAHAIGEVTLSEASVLSRLDRGGPATPGALAVDERVRAQAMASTLAALVQRGLVSRRPDPNDGRRAFISLTPSGRQVLLDRRRETTRRMARALAEGFTPTERRRLIAAVPLLERLAELL
jgi:DNA-binding MarR family transcriptional regulator